MRTNFLHLNQKEGISDARLVYEVCGEMRGHVVINAVLILCLMSVISNSYQVYKTFEFNETLTFCLTWIQFSVADFLFILYNYFLVEYICALIDPDLSTIKIYLWNAAWGFYVILASYKAIIMLVIGLIAT